MLKTRPLLFSLRKFHRKYSVFDLAIRSLVMDSHTRESSVDESQRNLFRNLSDRWWRPDSEFRALLSFNELRVPLVRDAYISHCLDATPQIKQTLLKSPTPLRGAKVLDVGCGGGLLSEPLAKLGAQVTGIDVVEENIQNAQAHWEQYWSLPSSKPSDGVSKENLQYICSPIEDFIVDHPDPFDIVVCSEVVEHVNAVDQFVESVGALVRPGGATVFTTLNRTATSFAMAIVGAEYLLRIVPRGTHSWSKFITPEELDSKLRKNGFSSRLVHGAMYNPLTNRWTWTNFSGVSYVLVAAKTGEDFAV